MMLTDRKIHTLKPSERDYTARDGNGLYLLIKKTGGKLWRYDFRFNGKHQRLALGKYPDMSLAEARKAHQEAREQVNKGINPCQERKTNKERRKVLSGYTIGHFVELAIKEKQVTDRTRAQNLAVFNNYFGEIANVPIKELDVSRLKNFLDGLKKFGETIPKRAAALLKAAYIQAIALQTVERNLILDIQPLIPKYAGGHFEVLPKDKLPDFLKDVFSRKLTITTAALRLLLFTMVRISEAVTAEWKDIDLDAGVWTIPYTKMKMGKKFINPDTTNHKIPLPRQAVEMLRALPRASNYIFMSPLSKSGFISKAIINKQIEDYDATIHGFRTLIGSILRDKGFNNDVINIQLGHKQRGLDAIYLRNSAMFEQRKEMLQHWADYMDALRADKVIKLDKVA